MGGKHKWFFHAFPLFVNKALSLLFIDIARSMVSEWTVRGLCTEGFRTTQMFHILVAGKKIVNRSLRESNNVDRSFRESNTTKKQLFFG